MEFRWIRVRIIFIGYMVKIVLFLDIYLIHHKINFKEVYHTIIHNNKIKKKLI